MIYTPLEYSKRFLFEGKRVSTRTIIRRCEKKNLPANHIPHKLPVKRDGAWIIEVKETVSVEATI